MIGALSGYIHCDIKVPKPLSAKSAIFPPFSKRQAYVDKILDQHWRICWEGSVLFESHRILLPVFELTNGKIMTPLLLGAGTRMHKSLSFRWVHFCQLFINIAQADTMKLLANNSFGYLTMDCSRHSVKSCMNDVKIHAVINFEKRKNWDISKTISTRLSWTSLKSNINTRHRRLLHSAVRKNENVGAYCNILWRKFGTLASPNSTLGRWLF